MKQFFRNLERSMTAITFSEAVERETAIEMLPPPRKKASGFMEKMFMAVTFAEAGMPEEALRIINAPESTPFELDDFFATIGLKGVHVTYGVFHVEASA